MIIFNLTIDLARLDIHKSADNLMQEIANILQVGKSDLVLSSIPWSISEYRLDIHAIVTETEERAIREVFKHFEFWVARSDFDNLGDVE